MMVSFVVFTVILRSYRSVWFYDYSVINVCTLTFQEP